MEDQLIMRYDVITVLDTCVDLIVNLGDVVPEFNQKEKWVDSFSLEMGGSNCIFACQSAKLGLKTAGIGIIGKDAFGHVITDGLSAGGVDISYIKTYDNLNTGLGVLLTRKDDRAILTCSGSIGAVSPDLVTDELLKSSRHLHIGSYYLLTGLMEELPDILRRAKSFGLSVSLDTNWDPSETWILPDELLSNVDILFPNENETRLLTNIDDVAEAALKLAQKVSIVAVKLGPEGGMVINKGNIIKHPAINVQLLDTIGAGDSFDAGFIYAYLNKMDLHNCLTAGIYCGSMNTTGIGGTSGQAGLDDLLQHLDG